MPPSSDWFVWALLSAVFAAMTAVLAKAGLDDVDPDFANLVRTAMVLVLLAGFVWVAGKWQHFRTLGGKALLFLFLSALATGASWVCYFRALQLGEAGKVN